VFVTVTKVLINKLDKTSLYSLLHRCASLAIVRGVLDWQGEPVCETSCQTVGTATVCLKQLLQEVNESMK